MACQKTIQRTLGNFGKLASIHSNTSKYVLLARKTTSFLLQSSSLANWLSRRYISRFLKIIIILAGSFQLQFF